jgi:hypothetical protein
VKITYVYPDEEKDRYRVQIRCRNLVNAIRSTGWHQADLLDLTSFAQQTEAAYEICSGSDIIVIYKYLYGPIFKAAQYWKARDKKVVLDIDEAVECIPPDLEEYRFWFHGVDNLGFPGYLLAGDGQPRPLEQFRWGLRLVDAVTTPSRRLVDEWADVAQVFYLPDYLNTDHYLAIKPDHPDSIRLCLRGEKIGTSGLLDSGVLPALEWLCKKRPNVKVVFINVQQDIFDSLDISAQQKEYLCWLDVKNWPVLLSSFDLGLIPVADEFGVRLSFVQAVEYMLMKIPWVSSDLPPYRELAQFGCLVPNVAEYWQQTLLEVVDHLSVFRNEVSGASFLYALGLDVNENISKVLATYEEILR